MVALQRCLPYELYRINVSFIAVITYVWPIPACCILISYIRIRNVQPCSSHLSAWCSSRPRPNLTIALIKPQWPFAALLFVSAHWMRWSKVRRIRARTGGHFNPVRRELCSRDNFWLLAALIRTVHTRHRTTNSAIARLCDCDPKESGPICATRSCTICSYCVPFASPPTCMQSVRPFVATTLRRANNVCAYAYLDGNNLATAATTSGWVEIGGHWRRRDLCHKSSCQCCISLLSEIS